MIRFILEIVKFTTLIFIFIFSLLSNAQKLENTLLWKISGNGIEKPSYLYGTMHAVCETNFNENVKKAFEETKQLYLEIDMDDPNLQMAMMQSLMMKDGTTMTSLITKEEKEKLDTFLKENTGFSIQLVNNFKPFMITSMYLPKLLDCPMKAVDLELMKLAKEDNEEVYGLETMNDQLAVFDKIPYKVQMEQLMEAVNSGLTKEKEEMKKMLEVYKTENIEEMLQFTKDSDNKITAEYQDELLINRNKNWIPVIEKTIKDTPTFFGVGAAHLAGENGVINLLRKEGYTVEAVQ